MFESQVLMLDVVLSCHVCALESLSAPNSLTRPLDFPQQFTLYANLYIRLNICPR